MKITFNTRRLYTQEGQVVTAEFNAETGVVRFNDHSRMVSGQFTVKDLAFCQFWWPDHPGAIARNVMHHYDHQQFDYLPHWEAPTRGEVVTEECL